MSNENSQSPVRQTMLPYGQQWLDKDDIDAVVNVLKGDYITQGPAIQEFEKKVANYVGAKYAVAFSNGTAALHGACYAAEIADGDEVITTPITFLASSNCVLYQGGTPVFADIDMDTYNIDPQDIKSKITEKTKAIIAVDFTGQPVEVDRISMIARDNNLVFIQDAAHSLGASFKGKKIGALADMTMFSFHPVKHVTTGEGGIITTNNIHYYYKLMSFRNHGITRNTDDFINNDGPWHYEMQDLGFNYRMTDMQAALGISQMSKLDSFIARRREIAGIYNEQLCNIPGIILPVQKPYTESSWHLYVIRISPISPKHCRRDWFEALRNEGIGVNVHYIPIYHQPYYKNLGYADNICENAETYYDTAISLPLFPKMTEQDINDVINSIKKVFRKFNSEN